MELAYRLAVEETPFIQQIRNNVIVVITPLVEVDGHDKQVDTWYYRKRTGQALPLMYWGKYVAHDNNRDGMGQSLKLTQNLMATFLDWHPTVFHDLHESVPYLYTSTGTGPYNTCARSARHRRVVDAVEVRDHRDDQARRARRLDVGLLRRLGAELPVLHRQLAQLDRSLLRDPELRPDEPGGHARRDADQPRVVPAEPAAREDQVGPAQQHRTCSSRRCSSR